jgi:hypothetical protein
MAPSRAAPWLDRHRPIAARRCRLGFALGLPDAQFALPQQHRRRRSQTTQATGQYVWTGPSTGSTWPVLTQAKPLSICLTQQISPSRTTAWPMKARLPKTRPVHLLAFREQAGQKTLVQRSNLILDGSRSQSGQAGSHRWHARWSARCRAVKRRFGHPYHHLTAVSSQSVEQVHATACLINRESDRQSYETAPVNYAFFCDRLFHNGARPHSAGRQQNQLSCRAVCAPGFERSRGT